MHVAASASRSELLAHTRQRCLCQLAIKTGTRALNAERWARLGNGHAELGPRQRQSEPKVRGPSLEFENRIVDQWRSRRPSNRMAASAKIASETGSGIAMERRLSLLMITEAPGAMTGKPTPSQSHCNAHVTSPGPVGPAATTGGGKSSGTPLFNL